MYSNPSSVTKSVTLGKSVYLCHHQAFIYKTEIFPKSYYKYLIFLKRVEIKAFVNCSTFCLQLY